MAADFPGQKKRGVERLIVLWRKVVLVPGRFVLFLQTAQLFFLFFLLLCQFFLALLK
jgi:hypothetical protein